jgi:phenylpropionate dioxygenase-like ring-hydroxylating dioxygenase large terminal subunit
LLLGGNSLVGGDEWLKSVHGSWFLLQLVPGAKIPKAACMRPYEVRESQGVIWVWLSQKTSGDPKKLPWFEYFAREGWGEVSFMQELPYDYSILLENLMDPAHLPISHDGSRSSARRKDAQALVSLKNSDCYLRIWSSRRTLSSGNGAHGILQHPFSCYCKTNKVFLQSLGSLDSGFAKFSAFCWSYAMVFADNLSFKGEEVCMTLKIKCQHRLHWHLYNFWWTPCM